MQPIASSYLLICCGSIFYIAPPNSSTPVFHKISPHSGSPSVGKLPSPIPKVKDPGVNININLSPNDGHLTVSDPANSGYEVEDKRNFVQINIFNNGAPKFTPQIFHSQLPNIDLQPRENDPHVHGNGHSELSWWKTSVIYQIYPRSFMDSNGTGTGDLKGITSKVDYLKELGIGAIWLSPIYASPMADFGYDVANFTGIDPIFGTLEDFDELLSALHARGIKIIMDFIPNHTSDKHAWFEKSVQKIPPYTDYYVWHDPKGFDDDDNPIPPNNWLSVFRFSAWEWNEERKQFYLHQFLKEQPDLNVRNPAVLEELNNVVRFWLDRGVDGFRIDALKHMFEVEDMSLDEPVAANTGIEDTNEYGYLNHTYSVNMPETIDAVREWRKIADSYEDRMLMVEVYDGDIQEIMKYYDNDPDLISHFPFNFYLITELHSRKDVTGENLKRALNIWLDNMPTGKWPNWVLGNHDNGRVATRLGKDLVDALNMLSLLLPGTPTTYYGEEIGMEDTFVTFDQVKDPFGLNFGPERYQEFGRDPERTPMQWDSSENSGFSDANSTWLPVNENYVTLNVESQENSSQSHLKVYQTLTKLRQEKTFTHGNFEYVVTSNELFAFVRSLDDGPSYLVVINTSPEEKEYNLILESVYPLPAEGIVKIRSSFDERSETTEGSHIRLDALSLLGGEGLVLQLV